MTDGALWGSSMAIAAAGAGMAYAVRGRSSAIFGPSMYHGDRTRRSLALTFDDGPSESTPQLLELLDAAGVRATFFMCGRNVERLPQIAREVAAAGHEIGNHSDTHTRLDFRSAAFIYEELGAAQRKITEAAGMTPKLFRAPYGVRWFGLSAAQKKLDLLGVMWTILGRDWRLRAPEIATRVTRAGGGDIICLHDGRGIEARPNVDEMLKAVRQSVPRLREAGLRFETVSELLRPVAG